MESDCSKKNNINDSLKTIKCKLKSVLRSDIDNSNLYESIQKANYCTFLCSHFIRSFIIHLYNNEISIPNINKQFIENAFYVMKIPSAGPKKKSYNCEIIDIMETYYNNEFSQLVTNKKYTELINGIPKISMSNISYITGATAIQMATSYENNIKLNFFKYVHQFINQYFKNLHNDIINKVKQNKGDMRKQLKSELFDLKKSLITEDNNHDPKYNEFIKKYKSLIFPNKTSSSYETDIQINPFNYVKHMLFMNQYLEKNGLKMFQSICLRTDLKDKYVTLNTNAMIDILPLTNKKEYFDNVHSRQHEIWNMFTNINNKKPPSKNYSFNYLIQTDGYTVSINYSTI